ncbi:MAG: pyrimidine dimer DNA glycosylase/endonuclease V [Pyrinomonadaceae bacterium]
MRIWTLHPMYLDAKGLVALWREGLLAQKVLRGLTKGYRNHPQLDRFKTHRSSEAAIAAYLHAVHTEALVRNYSFDLSKIGLKRRVSSITTTTGQIEYEWEHLKRKLRSRDPIRLRELERLKTIEPHPLFTIVDGEVEKWEIPSLSQRQVGRDRQRKPQK